MTTNEGRIWEAIERHNAERRLSFEEIAERHLRDRHGGNESGVVREVLLMAELGVFDDAYGWPPIIDVRCEFVVPGGRIDILLTHDDASASIIECKAGDRHSAVLPAIGQVMRYGAMIAFARVYSSVRLAIASRCTAAELSPLRGVFKAARIEHVFAGQHKRLAQEFARLSFEAAA